MTSIKINTNIYEDQSRIAGAIITEDSFGANFLFDRDRFELSDQPNGPSTTFDDAVKALGLSTLRYPGGTIAEKLFDIENPNSWTQNYSGYDGFDPDGDGPLSTTTLALDDFLTYCQLNELKVDFVMPTERFISDIVDNDGNRYSAVADQSENIQEFVLNLLSTALSDGVTVEAIEIGNEWYGTSLNATEYGRVASDLSLEIQSAIDLFKSTHKVPESWYDPDIVVQSGRSIAENDQIIDEFTANNAIAVVDGVLRHWYYAGKLENMTDSAFDVFDTWDQLTGKRLSKYVTEWNVAAGNQQETGLKAASTMIEQFHTMMAEGVDHADVWAVQQNNATNLTISSGSYGESWEGLSITGDAFLLMNDSLKGCRAVITEGVDNNILPKSAEVTVFASDTEVVVFVSNRTGDTNQISLDVSTMVAGYSHVWGAALGVGSEYGLGQDPTDSNAIPVVTTMSNSSLLSVNNGVAEFALDPFEVMRIVFTIGENGVNMAGYERDDNLTGSNYPDTIEGRGGNDILSGLNGDDLLLGDEGADQIMGGSGNDTLNGGGGSDAMTGGLGDDFYFVDSAGDRVIESRRGGSDTVVSELNYVIPGNVENAVLVGFNDINCTGNNLGNRIVGNDFDNVISGLGGNDTLIGGGGDDTLIGSSGDDTFIYSYGNDLIVSNKTVNVGFDTLILSKYNASDVLFEASGVNLLIHTPDGTIVLEDEVRYSLGSSKLNIDRIQFSDSSIIEREIRAKIVHDKDLVELDTAPAALESNLEHLIFNGDRFISPTDYADPSSGVFLSNRYVSYVDDYFPERGAVHDWLMSHGVERSNSRDHDMNCYSHGEGAWGGHIEFENFGYFFHDR